MKELVQFMKESSGPQFHYEVKYTLSDWNKWKKNRPDEIYVGTYEDDSDLELVYMPDHRAKTMKHIATYNTKTQVLFCDDTTLFGH